MVETAEQQLSDEELAELSVRCLTLTLSGMSLILPNTLVAEVTDSSSVTAAANTPRWFSGFVTWRGRTVPLIRYERLLGEEAESSASGRGRMVVLNTLNGNPRLPFIAMEVSGLPHLSLLKHGMLEYDKSEKESEPVVLSRLRVDGEQLIVPNLDVIERMLENLGISA